MSLPLPPFTNISYHLPPIKAETRQY